MAAGSSQDFLIMRDQDINNVYLILKREVNKIKNTV